MSRHRMIIVALGLIATLLLAGIVVAQVSSNFDLRWSLLTGGGGQRTSNLYLVQDSLGQAAVGAASSTNYRLESGFWPGAGAASVPATSTSTPTPTFTHTPTPTPTSTSTPPPPGDGYEPDNTCAQAHTIAVDAPLPENHNFNVPGDQDWIKFTASARRTFILQVSNTGPRADPVVLLYDACEGSPPPFGSKDDPFGPSLRVEWDGDVGKTYYIKLIQHDPSVSGDGTSYNVSVSQDHAQPGAPRNPRCAALSDTALSLQWDQPPDWDVVGYEVHWQQQGGGSGGAPDVPGAGNTYKEITGLTPLAWYDLWVQSRDYSNNISDKSATIYCRAKRQDDTTAPQLNVQQPVPSGSFSTTQRAIAIAGAATDSGNNLSRVKVLNTKTGLDSWDYSLSGNSHGFLVSDVGLLPGANTVQVTAFDDANNPSATTTLNVDFLTEVQGAVIIVAGHNEDFVLQSNIDYSANRAYRIFRGAGFAKEQIRYLAASPQDPDGDGVSEVFGDATTDNIGEAIQTWAATRVDAEKPLYLYMMDHGLIENFCASGCASGAAGSQTLDSWLTALETATGVDEVNVIIEACHSGSFIDRAVDVAKSISKTNRVVITSTDRDHNAYASAQGAYFSDTFFTCVATSKDLRTCFEQARAAVMVNPNDQTPWMDDNGDSVYNAGDGGIAQTRYIAKFFGASAPAITAASVTVKGASGTLTADVQQAGAKLEMVWAVIYPPSFVPPADTTLDLGLPMKKLDSDPNVPGRYIAVYPNGFSEAGQYRLVFYARDKADAYAAPKLVVPGDEPAGTKLYLPMVRR